MLNHPSNVRVKPDHHLYAGMCPRGVDVLCRSTTFLEPSQTVVDWLSLLAINTREELWTCCCSASAMLVDASAVQCVQDAMIRVCMRLLGEFNALRGKPTVQA